MKRSTVKPFCETMELRSSSKSQLSMRRFAQETSLHGWKYLGSEASITFKLLWAFVIAAAFLVSAYSVLFYSSQFLAATTVTSIYSTMVPISVNMLYKNSNFFDFWGCLLLIRGVFKYKQRTFVTQTNLELLFN